MCKIYANNKFFLNQITVTKGCFFVNDSILYYSTLSYYIYYLTSNNKDKDKL